MCHSLRIDPIHVADVGFDAKTAGSQGVYTYRVPTGELVEPGEARFVPLGPRRALGFVLRTRTVQASELGFELAALKPLGPRVDGIGLGTHLLALVEEVSRQTLVPPSVALGLVAPPAVKDRLATTWTPVPGVLADGLSTAQKEALAVLTAEGSLVDTKQKPLPDSAKRTLRALLKRGVAAQSIALVPHSERQRFAGDYRLTNDTALVEGFLTGPGRKRPAQALTLMRLQGSESASFSVQEIKSLGGVTDQTIRALIQAHLLVESEQARSQAQTPPTPNQDQAAAVKQIVDSVCRSSADEFLLFGVTGSGKTEVYLRCAAEALRQGRQVLFLVPEIALTAQVIAQLRERFGNLVAVMHSNMSPAERLESWLKVRSGECPVVLGPRSAVFAPVSNLGLIVVDEEHESSYKQENSPRYQTKSLVTFLARRFGCPVVFGSATPSIESYYSATTGVMRLLVLPRRAAEARLPTVEIADLTALYRERKPAVVSPQLEVRLRSALARGEQAILFLNRRAYSPFLICRDCGRRFVCQSCAVALAFHRKDMRLRCHQCGHQEKVPETCPDCQGSRVAPFGTGTEKVEDLVRSQFEGATVARLDRDVAKKKGALEETLAAFRSGDTQILVGTQMVAKGLDFPNVTVVGVVAADISLNVPDFRAGERTFQLLSQVAGRAGRGKSPGIVVIQTLNPENESVLAAAEHNYEAYFAWELEQRRESRYPPFVRLVNVLVTGQSRADVYSLSAVAAQRLKAAMPEAEVLGPANCALERLQNLWRRHILVKLDPAAPLDALQAALDGLKEPQARIVVDVDPASLA